MANQKISTYLTEVLALIPNDRLDISKEISPGVFDTQYLKYSTLLTELNGDLTVSNIYNTDGTLTGNRTLTLSTNDLDFDISGGGNFSIGVGVGLSVENIQFGDNVRIDGHINLLGNQFVTSDGNSTYIGTDAGENSGTVFGGGSGSNMIVGHESLGNVTTGVGGVTQSTTLGYRALFAATESTDNTAIGSQSMVSMTTGFRNTGVGLLTLQNITTGKNNAAFGGNTGKDYAGASENNTFLGTYAGGFENNSITNDGSIAIGYAAKAGGSNRAVMGSRHEKINSLYFNGEFDSTVSSFTIGVAGFSEGSNNYNIAAITDGDATGNNLIFVPPVGTGTGGSGSHIFQTAPAGATGNTQNALVNALEIDDTTTATETRLSIYDVDNAAVERVTVGIADSGGAGFKLLRIPN